MSDEPDVVRDLANEALASDLRGEFEEFLITCGVYERLLGGQYDGVRHCEIDPAGLVAAAEAELNQMPPEDLAAIRNRASRTADSAIREGTVALAAAMSLIGYCDPDEINAVLDGDLIMLLTVALHYARRQMVQS